MPRGPKEWSPIPDNEAALKFEAAVRDAFMHVYGVPEDPRTVPKSIRSSFLPEGNRLEWTEPNPGVVLVLTEYGWVQDPWASGQEYKLWERVMELLLEQGWGRAWWDSINPAVQVVMAD
jgi:hypothetical protein